MKTLYRWIISGLLMAPFILVLGVLVRASSNISFPPDALSVAWYQEMLTKAD